MKLKWRSGLWITCIARVALHYSNCSDSIASKILAFCGAYSAFTLMLLKILRMPSNINIWSAIFGGNSGWKRVSGCNYCASLLSSPRLATTVQPLCDPLAAIMQLSGNAARSFIFLPFSFCTSPPSFQVSLVIVFLLFSFSHKSMCSVFMSLYSVFFPVFSCSLCLLLSLVWVSEVFNLFIYLFFLNIYLPKTQTHSLFFVLSLQ